MYDTTLSQKYAKDMGLCKKKIRDAYPKKICHMLWHVKKKREKMHNQRRYATCLGISKKKERKEKIAPYPKRKKKGRWCMQKEFIHHPPKISTHWHILNKIYDLFLLWIWSLT